MSPRIDPQPWNQPKRPALEGVYQENTELAAAGRWPAGGDGPEDVAIGPDGSLYTALDDGRIMKYPPGSNEPGELTSTGGRPLGMDRWSCATNSTSWSTAAPDGRSRGIPTAPWSFSSVVCSSPTVWHWKPESNRFA